MSWRPQGWYKFRWVFFFPQAYELTIPKKVTLAEPGRRVTTDWVAYKIHPWKISGDTAPSPFVFTTLSCIVSKGNKNNTLTLSTQVQYLYGQGILYILLLVLQLFSHQAIIQHLKLFVRIWNKNGLHVDLWLTSVMTHMNFLKRHLLIAFSLPPCPGVFCRNYSIGLPPFLSLCLKQNPPYPLFDSSVA